MASFGELVPGRKLQKDELGQEGTGELDDRGPLDLTKGVVQLRRRTPAPTAEQPESKTE